MAFAAHSESPWSYGSGLSGKANIRQYTDNAYVTLDEFSTPLLQHVFAGDAVDQTVWLQHAAYKRYANDALNKNIRDLLNPRMDEFQHHDRQVALDQYTATIEETLRSGKYLLLELVPALENYDFDRKGFPLQLHLRVQDPKKKESFHCIGAHSRIFQPARATLSACVSVTNLHADDPALNFYPVADEARAKFIREKFNAHDIDFIAVVEQAGKYKNTKDGSLRYGNFMDPYAATGVLPVKILRVLVVLRSTGEILDASQVDRPAPAAPAIPAHTATPVPPPPAQVTATPDNVSPAPVLFRFDDAPTTPAKQNVPLPAPLPAPPPAPAQQRINPLIALLAYTVYSSPQHIEEADRALYDAQRLTQGMLNEAGPAKMLRSKEKNLQTAKDLQALKQSALQRNGAKLVDSQTYKGIYFERVLLNDGRTVVVFRGSANDNDLAVDLQLAMSSNVLSDWGKKSGNPALAAGLAKFNKQSNSTANSGIPPAFKASVEIVDQVIRSGVKPASLILAGHSLGGGYASYAGYLDQVGEIVTFNPAPLNEVMRQELAPSVAKYSGRVANYISFLPPVDGDGTQGKGTYDPVSQKLSNDRPRADSQDALQILGPQYVVSICDTRGTPDYLAYRQSVQDTAGSLGGSANPTLNALTDKSWLAYSAHQMKNLYEAMQDGAALACAVRNSGRR